MYVLTIHYLKSIGFAMAFITALSFAIHNNDELNEEFKDVFFGDVIFIIIMCIITPYYTEKQWRDNFLKNRQIEILMKEQKNLFDLLPDGLVIHSNEIANDAEGS